MTDNAQTEERTSVIHDCLACSRRRHVLRRLADVETPLALADLAEDVADRETETSRADIDDQTIKEVHVSLYHNHVPKLADAGLVQFDRERRIVELSAYPEALSDDAEFLAAG